MNTNKFVIKVENKNPVNHPLTYSNFLSLFPACPIQETPTNDVIGPYGYEVFELLQEPTVGEFEYPPIRHDIYVRGEDGVWKNTWERVPFTEQQISEKIELKRENVINLISLHLLATEWTQLETAVLTQQELLQWNAYRQQLQDLLDNINDPFNVVLPVPPYPEQINLNTVL